MRDINLLKNQLVKVFLNYKYRRKRMSKSFRKSLEELLNYHSKENGSNTPDYVLAEYLDGCLKNFDKTMKSREQWFGAYKEK
jgi:hypothetical protein